MTQLKYYSQQQVIDNFSKLYSKSQLVVTGNVITPTNGANYIRVQTTSGDANIQISSSQISAALEPITIIDESGTVDSSRVINITTEGGEAINDISTGIFKIDCPFGSVTLYPNGSALAMPTQAFPTTVMEADDTTDQITSTLLVPELIQFGGDQDVAGAPVKLVSNLFTFNQGAEYDIYPVFTIARGSSTQTEQLNIQPFINGVETRRMLIATMSIADEFDSRAFPFSACLKAGETLSFTQVATITQGSVDIGLRTKVSPVTDYGTAFSASMTIRKLS